MTAAGIHSIRITVPDGIGVLSRIEVDGVQLNGVTVASFTVDADHMARVTLEMYADLIVEGEAEIVQVWRQGLPWWRRLPYWLHWQARA